MTDLHIISRTSTGNSIISIASFKIDSGDDGLLTIFVYTKVENGIISQSVENTLEDCLQKQSEEVKSFNRFLERLGDDPTDS